VVQEKEGDPALSVLQVKVVSDSCMYVCRYNESLVMEWKRKADPIFDIIEVLEDGAAKKWMDTWYNSEDAYNYEEDEE
jgi:hypothetical protein